MVERVLMGIVYWPATAYAEVQQGDILPVAAAVGASVYLLGVPSASMSLSAMAQSYAATGALLLGANYVLSSEKQAVAQMKA